MYDINDGTIEVASVIDLSQGSRARCKFVFSPAMIDNLVIGMVGTGIGALQKKKARVILANFL